MNLKQFCFLSVNWSLKYVHLKSLYLFPVVKYISFQYRTKSGVGEILYLFNMLSFHTLSRTDKNVMQQAIYTLWSEYYMFLLISGCGMTAQNPIADVWRYRLYHTPQVSRIAYLCISIYIRASVYRYEYKTIKQVIKQVRSWEMQLEFCNSNIQTHISVRYIANFMWRWMSQYFLF